MAVFKWRQRPDTDPGAIFDHVESDRLAELATIAEQIADPAERDRLESLRHELDHPQPIDAGVRSLALRSAATSTRHSLTAAVSMLDATSTGAGKQVKGGDRSWQSDAWRLYDITGQLRFVANWAGACLSRCILRVHEVTDQGNIGAIVDDPEISQLGSGPLGIGNSRAEALRLCGIDLFVAGEAYLIAESEGGPNGSDLWWVVTARQIKKLGDTITIPRSPMHGGGVFTYRPGVDLILRMWTPHPDDANEPDSSTRSAIPDLRLMEAIRRRQFAELDSRLTGAGLLFVPDSIDLPRGEDDPEGPDGFATMLMRTMATSLRDRTSAAAMVPIVVQGAADDIEKVKHLTFWTPMSEQLSDMWKQALTGLGESLDVPPEVMAGLGGSNHWSAWAISDAAVGELIEPLAGRVAAALTVGYLWPALESLGYDPEKYVYQFDTGLLVVRPNRTADAMTYHAAGLISDETARNAGAWNDDDEPDQHERARRLAERLVIANIGALADPAIRALLELPALESAPAGTQQGQGQGPQQQPAPIEQGPPQTQPTGTTPRPDDQQPAGQPGGAAYGGLDVALSMVARRAMTLAGQRLIPHGQRSRYPVEAYQLAASYGPVVPDQVGRLLDGAWRDIDLICESYQLDRDKLASMLDDFCHGLLVRGISYGDDLVRKLVAAPGLMERIRR
jgi:hypothetical protein